MAVSAGRAHTPHTGTLPPQPWGLGVRGPGAGTSGVWRGLPAGGRPLPVSGRAEASSLRPFSCRHQPLTTVRASWPPSHCGLGFRRVHFGGTQTSSPWQPPNSKHTLQTLYGVLGRAGEGHLLSCSLILLPGVGAGFPRRLPTPPRCRELLSRGCSEDTRCQHARTCRAGAPAARRSMDAGGLTPQSFIGH